MQPFLYRLTVSGNIIRLAWQRWKNEQIAQETFFYDPVQFKRV